MSIDFETFYQQTTCYVIIRLRDVNEFAPKFTSDHYRAQFVVAPESEDLINEHCGIYDLGGKSSLDQIILNVHAVDPDYGINGRIFYSIIEGKIKKKINS